MNNILRFNQIYPHQPLPCLAADYAPALPLRAQHFCQPFRAAALEGVLAFAPIEFEFLLEAEQLTVRAPCTTTSASEKGAMKTVTVSRLTPSNNNFILLSDVNAKRSKACLKQYRQRIPDSLVPESIDKEDFGFYEIFINVIVEEAPFDCFIQIWLGGTVELGSPSGSVRVQHPSNITMDAGFQCLDAIIDTQLWQGWLAVVLKPTRLEEWVKVPSTQPICQMVGHRETINALQNREFKDVEEADFLTPLNWHLFDPNYAAKPGKYQRQLRAKRSEEPSAQ